MSVSLPRRHGDVALRLIRSRDARILDKLLTDNDEWLRPWTATNPNGVIIRDMRMTVRHLLESYREGTGLPLVIVYGREVVGQMNVWGISHGSLQSATAGYWISEEYAGKGITPISLALITDLCFQDLQLHRMEICIRPENTASLRVVEKLGFVYEGLRRRYIHIDGQWCDHHAFALLSEDVPEGVLARFVSGANAQNPPVMG